MAYDETLAERIREHLAKRKNIVEKKLFGGVGFLLNGNLCVGVWKESLIVRLDVEQAEAALREPEVTEFTVGGRPMKGWLLVGPAGLKSDGELKGWIQKAVDFVAGEVTETCLSNTQPAGPEPRRSPAIR